MKIVPKYKQKQQIPVSGPSYWKGFNDGQEHERKVCIHYFISKIEELKQVDGIGEKTFQKIVDHVNKEW